MSLDVGVISYTIDAKTAALLTADKQISDFNDKAQAGFEKTDRKVNGLNSSMGKLTQIAKGVAAALVTNQVFAYANAWADMEDRLKNTGLAGLELKDVQEQLMETSNRNGRTIEESAELYIRLSNSMKEMGYSTQGTLSYIDTLSNLMTINKTNAIKSEAAINALTKAQMKGKLSRMEMISVFSAMPSLLKTLAKHYKTDEAGVRKMASDGKLSMSEFNQALIDSQEETAALADNMRNNLGDAANHFTNRLKQTLGELDNTTGATQSLVTGIKYLAENMDVLVTSAGFLASILAGKYLTSLGAVTKAKLSSALASRNEAKAEIELANAELKRIAAERESTILAQKSLSAQLKLAQTEKTRLAVRNQLAANSAKIIALDKQEIATKNALAVATTRASTAVNVLKGGLNLLGGPAGVMLMVASAFISFAASASEARRSAIDLKDNIEDLTESFKAMNEEQREAQLVKLEQKLSKQADEIKAETTRLNAALTNLELKSQGQIGLPSFEELNDQIKLIKGSLADMQQGYDKQKAQLDALNEKNTELANSTNTVTESTKALKDALSDTAKTEITKKIADLSTQLEIAQLKQKGLNKESYVYQTVLSALGDDADKYKTTILEAANNGTLFKYGVKGLPAEIQPLITKLGELWSVTNQGKEPLDNMEASIQQLSTELEIAKLEAQGLIDKANELRAIQTLGLNPNNSKEIEENSTKIEQMQKLIEQQNQLNLAKQGVSIATQEVESREDPIEALNKELQAKQEAIDAAHAQGLLNEQEYNDAVTAMLQNSADKLKKINDEIAADKLKATQDILSSTSDLFGGMADLTKTFAGEQSSAYKAMFAISKGFAVANAALHLKSAIMTAMDSGPYPANLAAMAKVAAAGSSLVSQLSSINYGGGRLRGGEVDPSSFYRINESGKPEILESEGKQYLLPNKHGNVIPANKTGNSGSQPIVNWQINIINNNGSDIQQTVRSDEQVIEIAVSRAEQKVALGISERTGAVWRSLSNTTNVIGKN